MSTVAIAHSDQQGRAAAGLQPAHAAGSEPRAATSLQFLSFRLAGQTYFTPIAHLLEVRVQSELTRIAHTAPFLLGILNLRGAAVAVVDLRLRFGLEPQAVGVRQILVVVEASHDERGQARWVAAVVDGVDDIVASSPQDIHSLPDLPYAIEAKYLTGLALLGTRYVPVVDFRLLLSPQELAQAVLPVASATPIPAVA